MLVKNIDIFQFFGKAKSLLMAKLVEPLNALLGLDFIRATGETLYLFPYFFRTCCYGLGLCTTAFSVHNGTAKKKWEQPKSYALEIGPAAFELRANFKLGGMTSRIRFQAPKRYPKWLAALDDKFFASLERDFTGIGCTMEAQTTASNSTQCGFFIGEYKKYTLSGVTFSFKLHTTPQEDLRSILLLCTNKDHYYFCRTYLWAQWLASEPGCLQGPCIISLLKYLYFSQRIFVICTVLMIRETWILSLFPFL